MFNIDAYVETKDLKSKQIRLTSLFGSRALEGKDPKIYIYILGYILILY